MANTNQQFLFLNSKMMNKAILIFGLGCMVTVNVLGQKDTTKTQTIDITSSFKPVLRNAVKINFSGSQLPADTSRPPMNYNIPSQNLFYAYQPISLKPLALTQDTNLYLGGRNYLKAGFGNYSTPYFAAGVSFGDGKKSLLNITADYIQSKGNDIEYQDYAMLNIKAAGSYFTPKNEVYAAAAFSADNYYLYGYDHKLFTYTKDELRQQFQDLSISGGIRNIIKTPNGISYNPSLLVNFFTNVDKLSESTIIIDAPVEKELNEMLTIKLTGRGDFTNYSTKSFDPNNIKFGNNIIQVTPAVEFNTAMLKLHGGVTPTWSNGDFYFLPDISAEFKLRENGLLLQGGWVGRYIKNTYRNLSAINPYLQTLTEQNNTKEIEFYGGIKSSIGKHFNFSAKAGWVIFKDLPLFVNDTSSDGKSFIISNETQANDFRIHGDISYINKDKLTITAGLTFNGYSGLQVNEKAWQTIPLQFTTSLRWWAYERLLIKGDFYFFNGVNYLTKVNESSPLLGGSDLSAGAEYKINKQFSAWVNFNNILNDKYERWHNYEVYGFNLTAGILINF